MIETISNCGVVPLHNHQKWVADAIRSIAPQVDFVVVVNDGSTDESLTSVIDLLEGEVVCFSLAKRKIIGGRIGGRMILIYSHPSPKGPAAARNQGVKIACEFSQKQLGRIPEVVFFLDSDDTYLPHNVERCLREYSLDKSIAIVYSDYYNIYHSGKPNEYKLPQAKQDFSRDLLLRECIVNCNSMVKTEVLLKEFGFDESLRTCEDYDFFIRVSEKYRIFHVPECLGERRIGEHSSTHTVAKKIWQDNYFKVFDKMRQRRGG